MSILQTQIKAAKNDMVEHIKKSIKDGKTAKGSFPTSKIIDVIKKQKLEMLGAGQIYQLFDEAFEEALAS